jgi:hypothetical protein
MDTWIICTVVYLTVAKHSCPTPVADACVMIVSMGRVDTSGVVLAEIGCAIVYFTAGVAVSKVVFIADTATATAYRVR